MQLLAGLGPLGLPELAIILVIVILIFGVGRLPEVGGAVGKGIREFRKATKDDEADAAHTTMTSTSTTDAASMGMGSTTTSPDMMQSTSAPIANGSNDTLFCGECGARNPRTSKFCAECGHVIGAPVR